MFGAMGKTPALNGGIRGSSGGDDEDEDDDDDGARFRKDAISLDQVSLKFLCPHHPLFTTLQLTMTF